MYDKESLPTVLGPPSPGSKGDTLMKIDIHLQMNLPAGELPGMERVDTAHRRLLETGFFDLANAEMAWGERHEKGESLSHKPSGE